MKRKQLTLVLVLLSLLSLLLVAAALPNPVECAELVQMGETRMTIPAGSSASSAEIPIVRCAGMNVSVTGGTPNRVPVVINASLHQDRLIVDAHLLAPQPGPTDVTIWWRID